MVVGSSQVAVTYTSDLMPAFKKDFADIQATIECGFTLKRIGDMIKIQNKMGRTDRYSQQFSII